jgi:hypothetical protein
LERTPLGLERHLLRRQRASGRRDIRLIGAHRAIAPLSLIAVNRHGGPKSARGG